MTFGLLGSIIPQINKNEILYQSPLNTLTIGKVSISSKNYNPVKIRLGISTDNINVEYLEYNRFINYGESFETEEIYVGNSQRLSIRSTNSNVNFLFYGETFDETANPVKSGLLNSVQSSNNQKKELYSVPINAIADVTLSVCNLDSQPAKARIGISNFNLNSFDSSEYLEYDVEIGPNQTYTRNNIKLSATQTLVCSSSEDSNINFVCHGRLTYGVASSQDLNVPGNLRVNGNIGIGTIFARQKLDVIGNALISGGLSVSGIITGNLNPTNVNQALLNLGALPSVDGSALTGVVAQSTTGVQIRENNTTIGVATVINFDTNILATFATGIATVTTSNDFNIVQNFTVATNKFSVVGATGNTQIAGTLGISSSLSVSGNIDALNNKVINVGTATSALDVTNKSYVDTRSIAMSIALS
jgi:cytoskeletal protein CcmA (bactofilin family)